MAPDSGRRSAELWLDWDNPGVWPVVTVAIRGRGGM